MAELSIEDIFTLAGKKGLVSRKWTFPRLKNYNGFSHEQRVRKWQALHFAIQLGLEKLPEGQSCSICESTSNVTYHSEDYSSLFGHYIVCKSCHHKIHGRFKNPELWRMHVERYGNKKSWFFNLPNQPSPEGKHFKLIKHEQGGDMNILSQLKEFDFPDFRQVTNRWSIAELYKPQDRCGIYVLRFADDSYYIGKSIDVAQRFSQHRARFNDIEDFTYIPYPETKQAVFEKNLIHLLESDGIKLRNREHMSQPLGASDLDYVISEQEQDAWLKDVSRINPRGASPVDESMYLRYRDDYQKFERLPDSEKYLSFMTSYLDAAIPSWEKTQMSFWALSCLPKSRYALTYKQPAIARVNISRQEVLTVGINLNFEGKIFQDFCIFFLAESPFLNTYGGSQKFAQHHSHAHTWSHRYKDGGHDQTCIIVDGITNAKELLDEPTFRKSLRLFNLNLMRKNACFWKQNHCLPLVEAISKHS